MNVTGTVTIKLRVSTDIDATKVIGHDVNLPDIDLDKLSEDFQEWAEEEYGLMFEDRPESIEAEMDEV